MSDFFFVCVLLSCVVGLVYAAHLKPKHFLLSPPAESSAESNLVAELQEKLQEEKMKFLEQLEEQEKRKNEEMQNIRTSLTAEQQVKLIFFLLIFAPVAIFLYSFAALKLQYSFLFCSVTLPHPKLV